MTQSQRRKAKINIASPSLEKDKGDILEKKVEGYFDEHGVKASIPTTYTTLAVTLQRDFEKIVLFQCKSTPAGAYINYADYMNMDENVDKDKIKVKEENALAAEMKFYKKPTIDS